MGIHLSGAYTDHISSEHRNKIAREIGLVCHLNDYKLSGKPMLGASLRIWRVNGVLDKESHRSYKRWLRPSNRWYHEIILDNEIWYAIASKRAPRRWLYRVNEIHHNDLGIRIRQELTSLAEDTGNRYRVRLILEPNFQGLWIKSKQREWLVRL